MANAMVTIIFQISDATPIISLLIRVISGFKVNFKYLWDLDEMFFTKQLKDGEYNDKVPKPMPLIRISFRVLILYFILRFLYV